MDWNNLVEDKEKWWADLNTVMNDGKEESQLDATVVVYW